MSCIGVEIGVFSISIMANGASGSGRGETELSIGAASPAGSDDFPALLPNLTTLLKPFSIEELLSDAWSFHFCVHNEFFLGYE